MYVDSGIFDLFATVALIVSLYCLYRVNSNPKYKLRSSHQYNIDRYFENMRWYGFKDDEIAEMIHTDHDGHQSIRMANKKAKKERTGRI